VEFAKSIQVKQKNLDGEEIDSGDEELSNGEKLSHPR